MHHYDIAAHKGRFFTTLGKTDLSQVGVMTIEPGGDSGQGDMHPGDQIIYIIEGEAFVEVAEESETVPTGHCVVIPKGSEHRIYNKGDEALFFLTLYTPPAY